MRGSLSKLVLAALLFAMAVTIAGEPDLKSVLSGDHRSEENKARDVYRKPAEVLAFLGINSHMTVAEIYPSGGWYTEVLGPYLKAGNGKLVAVGFNRDPETQKEWMAGSNKRFHDAFVSKPEVYGQIELGQAVAGDIKMGADNSLDAVLDFRNAHNWIGWGSDEMPKAWFKALKKGGVVGVVDHRQDADKALVERSGYIHEKQIVDIMLAAGFKLEGRSEILANAKDTKDHPKGVWTLPPVLALKEVDAAKYKAIGESDRMLLKFVKP